MRGAVVPLYVHPLLDPMAWRNLEELGPGLRCVVVNVADGPGSPRDPDPEYVRAVHRLRRAHVTVAGYVDLAYGARSTGVVHRDVDTWRSEYDVSAFFLDRYPSHVDPRAIGVVEWLVRGGADLVVANPGVHPDPAAVDRVDLCVTFEGDVERYRAATGRSQADSLGATDVAHLVYDVPPEDHAEVGDLAAARGAAGYVTEGRGSNPWDRLAASLSRQPVGHS
jgi:hypothetical protein